MRRTRRSGATKWVLAVPILTLGCGLPSQRDIDNAQAIQEFSSAFTQLQNDQALMQEQIDSLKFILIRQDSVLRTLANLAGVSVPR